MLLVHIVQDLASGGLISLFGHLVWSDLPITPSDWSFLAQQFETDVFADFRNFLTNFVESGQVWALIIGFILGYMIKGLTSYG
ncbi:MAG: hypothetical protein ACFE0I_18360 [Elainellaceae cyanobacterium]